MRLIRSHAVLFAVLIFSIVSTTASAQTDARRSTASQPPEISFTVSMPRPVTHLLEVEMQIRAPRGQQFPATVDLVMPVWTPGSYLIREYARHVQDFNVTNVAGREVRWSKINKNTWRIDAGSAASDRTTALRVTYRVYANELSVRTNELNDRHAFWNNAALLMYVDGFLNAPSTLRVVPFQNWQIASGLPQVQGSRNTFRAENFDILYDSPVLVGTLRTLEFTVRNVPHRIVIDGEGNYDAERMRRDVQRIVEVSLQMMEAGNNVPYRDYTFLLLVPSRGGGGLEHLNSTALIWPRFNFSTPAAYTNFLTLVAHEYFHVWNVKNIRPDALGPFDYTAENYTRLLWVAEGLTSYYENVLVRRAGLMTEEDFLSRTASAIEDLQNTPGRLAMSVEEASFDAWIKYYRQDENSVNSQISYYDKGSLLGMLLDLEIRQRTANARSLDDVMRRLYTDFAQRNRNYTPEDFERVSEEVAGTNLDEFFASYVRGREELPFERILAYAGLELNRAPNQTARPFFGADLTQDGDRLNVTRVRVGTPAYDQGLSAGDQIVAVDGVRVTRDAFNARISERRPGDEITLSLFRNDDLRTLRIRLGSRTEGNYRITRARNPTPEQTRIYQSWLGGASSARTSDRRLIGQTTSGR